MVLRLSIVDLTSSSIQTLLNLLIDLISSSAEPTFAPAAIDADTPQTVAPSAIERVLEPGAFDGKNDDQRNDRKCQGDGRKSQKP